MVILSTTPIPALEESLMITRKHQVKIILIFKELITSWDFAYSGISFRLWRVARIETQMIKIHMWWRVNTECKDL